MRRDESADPFGYSGKLRFVVRAGRDARLCRADLGTLIVLVDHARRESGQAYPSLTTIAAAAGIGRSTAIRSLRRLETLGWIASEKRAGALSSYLLTSSDIETSSDAETGSGLGTRINSNLRRGRTSSGLGTEAVPVSEHEQREELKSIRGKNALSSDESSPWTTAVALLTKSGLQETKARSIVGKVRKILKNDDTTLKELVGTAERDGIAEPGAWLFAAATRRATGPRAPRAPIASASAADAESTNDAAIARLRGAHE